MKLELKDLKEKNGLYYVGNIIDINNKDSWVIESEALSILESYNQMVNDD